MPTSGNVFSRSFLSRVMPMPEADWRGHADAYLINLAPLVRAWILERGATVYEKRICTSLPSSLRIAWNGVLKPRHFLGVRLVVRTISWISSSDTLSMSI